MSECINSGGGRSLLRLERAPTLEEEASLVAGSHAALKAWRARPGEILTVSDPMKTCYRARLLSLDAEGGRVVPFQQLNRPVESPLGLEVYQALPEKERFELVLQKLTEIGVSRVVPFESRRSTTQEERDRGQRKSHRWPEVVLRAARQCRRAMLPELFGVQSWDAALYLANQADLKLMLYEGEPVWRIEEALAAESPNRVALLVGPEGGFAPEEVEEARTLGWLPVSLGPRLLRTETAAMVAAALVQHRLGDLG